MYKIPGFDISSMILVVVAKSIVKENVFLIILCQVEFKAAYARFQCAFDEISTCDVIILFHAVCIVYYMFFDLKM